MVVGACVTTKSNYKRVPRYSIRWSEIDMVNYEDRESVDILEAQGAGDNFRRVTRTVGVQDDGDDFDFISYKKGYLAESDDDGETEEVFTDSFSLGDPQYADDLIDALQELQEEIED